MRDSFSPSCEISCPSSTYAALKRRSVELAGGGQMFYWAQLLAGLEFPRDATDAAAPGGESYDDLLIYRVVHLK